MRAGGEGGDRQSSQEQPSPQLGGRKPARSESSPANLPAPLQGPAGCEEDPGTTSPTYSGADGQLRYLVELKYFLRVKYFLGRGEQSAGRVQLQEEGGGQEGAGHGVLRHPGGEGGRGQQGEPGRF